VLHTNFCTGVGRYGAPLASGGEGSGATIDERISFFGPDLIASEPDCDRAELGKNAQASRQKQIVFFMALTTTAVAVAPRIGQEGMPFNGRGLTTLWNVYGPPSIDFAAGYSRRWRASLRKTVLE
jgi:hypothetical protein